MKVVHINDISYIHENYIMMHNVKVECRYLSENIKGNIKVIGEIKDFIICHPIINLDLSELICTMISYDSIQMNNEKYDIKNHILPKNLKILTIHNINHLPNHLPNSISKLDCSNNNLSELPKLPEALKILNCSNNNLSELPKLPKLLTKLICLKNNLIKLPKLPNSLTYLDCSNNNLIKLSKLPNSLIILDCKSNNIENIKLNDSIKRLNIENNKLKEINDLPSSLKFLSIRNNEINYIDSLPPNLFLNFNQSKELDYISYNPNIKISLSSNFKIKDYPINITNQEQWDEYMNYKLNQMNRIKSARK